MENLVVILIVGAALFYAGFRVYRTLRRPSGACGGCGSFNGKCGGCDLAKYRKK